MKVSGQAVHLSLGLTYNPGGGLIIKSCPALCDPMDYKPTRLLCPWDFPARILEWVAISFSRGSSPVRDQTWVSCITGGFFTN